MREFVIIVIIFIIIIGGAMYVQKFLNDSSNEIISQLNDLKQNILSLDDDKNREKIKEQVNDVYKKWEEIEEKWAIIVLHSELDLIETSFIKMKSGIEEGELNRSLEELDTCIFLVNHISNTEKFCLKNVF